MPDLPHSVPASLNPQAAARALAMARATFDIAAAAVLGLKDQVGESFVQAVAMVLAIKGRVVVMGMGKSGDGGVAIGRRLGRIGNLRDGLQQGQGAQLQRIELGGIGFGRHGGDLK